MCFGNGPKKESVKMRGKVYVVTDGQAGSCGKGKLVGYLARKLDVDITMNHNMPNAGHTFVFDDGRKVVTHHLPIGVVNPRTTLLIGAGAVINPDILYKELEENKDLINGRMLYIHERAAVVFDKHIAFERENIRSGSTFQGSAAANAEKSLRMPGTILAKDYPWKGKIFIYDDDLFFQMRRAGLSVLIEMSQGFDLDMNHGLPYPYTTSRGCTITDALADCGIPYNDDITSYMIFRPYPIRISNDSVEGKIYTGDYAGSREISWEEVCERAGLNYIEEYTTVTKKKRRVFEFSWSRFYHAIEANNPDYLVLNFAQYLDGTVLESKHVEQVLQSSAIMGMIANIKELYNKEVIMIGTGAKEGEIIDLSKEKEKVYSKRS